MLRKEILTVLMADGYPINGKPKDKTEKMHPEIWKRYAIFFAVIAMALAVVIGYFAFAGQTPLKTSQDASTEVKTAEVQPNNPAVNTVTAETGSYVPINTYDRKDIPLSSIPEKIVFTEFYARDLKAQGDYYYGYIGPSTPLRTSTVRIEIAFLNKEGAVLKGTNYELSSFNQKTKEYNFGIMQSGYDLPVNNGEKYFRIKKPAEASFLTISRFSG